MYCIMHYLGYKYSTTFSLENVTNEKLPCPPHCHTQHATGSVLEDNTLQKYVLKLWTDSPSTVYVEISISAKISNCICKDININNL